MKNMKRVVLIVLDGVGAGYQHDAQKYGDVGADTLGHVIAQEHPDIPNLAELGLLKTVDMHPLGEDEPIGCYGTMEEAAAGKDTTTGHWEIAGLTLKKPFPTYPHGFPKEVIDAFEEETGMGTLGNKPASGTAIIKGAQGATGTATIATFTAGFVLVMITLIIVLNLTRSRAGRAIMAIRDNHIAAQAIGLNLTKYKLMAFVTSAALAGAAGALYGLNYSSLQATKFNFNLSILVLVFVVLGGLGNIWGSLVAAAALTILPEALRQFSDFRMLIYAIVLIIVMLATNNPQAKAFFQKLLPHRRAAAEKED